MAEHTFTTTAAEADLPIGTRFAAIAFVLPPAAAGNEPTLHTIRALWAMEEDGVPYAEYVSRDHIRTMIAAVGDQSPQLAARLREVLKLSDPPADPYASAGSSPSETSFTHGAGDRANICALQLAALGEEYFHGTPEGARMLIDAAPAATNSALNEDHLFYFGYVNAPVIVAAKTVLNDVFYQELAGDAGWMATDAATELRATHHELDILLQRDGLPTLTSRDAAAARYVGAEASPGTVDTSDEEFFDVPLATRLDPSPAAPADSPLADPAPVASRGPNPGSMPLHLAPGIRRLAVDTGGVSAPAGPPSTPGRRRRGGQGRSRRG